MNNLLFLRREMDSPISINITHPYGRRRVGTKEHAGAVVQMFVYVCAFVFIRDQMYKLY